MFYLVWCSLGSQLGWDLIYRTVRDEVCCVLVTSVCVSDLFVVVVTGSRKKNPRRSSSSSDWSSMLAEGKAETECKLLAECWSHAAAGDWSSSSQKDKGTPWLSASLRVSAQLFAEAKLAEQRLWCHMNKDKSFTKLVHKLAKHRTNPRSLNFGFATLYCVHFLT